MAMDRYLTIVCKCKRYADMQYKCLEFYDCVVVRAKYIGVTFIQAYST